MFDVGLGKSAKKSDVLSIKKEWKMILQAICQLTFLIVLNLRFGYFCIKNCVSKRVL